MEITVGLIIALGDLLNFLAKRCLILAIWLKWGISYSQWKQRGCP